MAATESKPVDVDQVMIFAPTEPAPYFTAALFAAWEGLQDQFGLPNKVTERIRQLPRGHHYPVMMTTDYGRYVSCTVHASGKTFFSIDLTKRFYRKMPRD